LPATPHIPQAPPRASPHTCICTRHGNEDLQSPQSDVHDVSTQSQTQYSSDPPTSRRWPAASRRPSPSPPPPGAAWAGRWARPVASQSTRPSHQVSPPYHWAEGRSIWQGTTPFARMASQVALCGDALFWPRRRNPRGQETTFYLSTAPSRQASPQHSTPTDLLARLPGTFDVRRSATYGAGELVLVPEYTGPDRRPRAGLIPARGAKPRSDRPCTVPPASPPRRAWKCGSNWTLPTHAMGIKTIRLQFSDPAHARRPHQPTAAL